MIQWTKSLNTPGTHSLTIPALVGQLEIELSVPENADTRYFAIIGHPHSLQGGTMQNKVVTTLARVFNELHIPNLRFNFRGVGASDGVYDDGIGESEDMLLIAREILEARPDVSLIFAGFSFGSFVAYRAAAQCEHALLIMIAPSVEHYNYTEFSTFIPKPLIVVQGDEDEVVPAEKVFDLIAEKYPEARVLRFENTTHFFHGKLIELKARLLEVIPQSISL